MEPKTIDCKRREFEAWASNYGQFPAAVERSGEGYRLSVTQTYWSAWKVRQGGEPMTYYIGSIYTDSGYNGHGNWLHLCQEPNGRILAVHSAGFHTWAFSPIPA